MQDRLDSWADIISAEPTVSHKSLKTCPGGIEISLRDLGTWKLHGVYWREWMPYRMQWIGQHLRGYYINVDPLSISYDNLLSRDYSYDEIWLIEWNENNPVRYHRD